MQFEGCKCQAYPSIEYPPETNDERLFIQSLMQEEPVIDEINIILNEHDLAEFPIDIRKGIQEIITVIDQDFNQNIVQLNQLEQQEINIVQEEYYNPEYKKELEEEKKRQLKLKKEAKSGKSTTKKTSKSTTKKSTKTAATNNTQVSDTTVSTTETSTIESQQQNTKKEQSEKQKTEEINKPKEQSENKPKEQVDKKESQPVVDKMKFENKVEEKQNNVIDLPEVPEKKPNRSILQNQEQNQNLIPGELHMSDFIPKEQQTKESEQQHIQKEKQPKQEVKEPVQIQESKIEQPQKIQQQIIIPETPDLQKSNLVLSVSPNTVNNKLQNRINQLRDVIKQQEIKGKQNKPKETVIIAKQPIAPKYDPLAQDIDKLKFNIQKIQNQLVVSLNQTVIYQSDIAKMEIKFDDKQLIIYFGAYKQRFNNEMYKKIKSVLQQLQKQAITQQRKSQTTIVNKQHVHFDERMNSLYTVDDRNRIVQSISLKDAEIVESDKFVIYRQKTGESVCVLK